MVLWVDIHPCKIRFAEKMTSPITRESLESLRQDIIFSEDLYGENITFHTTWGLFSPREMDAGTRLLLDHIQLDDESLILDLGCGYGALGLPLAKRWPLSQVHLIDKDFVAIDFCRKNATVNELPNAHAQLSNGLNQVTAQNFDAVVTNLPAKSGKELYYLMFYDVHSRLKQGGRFYIVTITGLRGFVKRTFNEIFGNYEKLKQGKVYTVAMAIRR